jgi:hypothetical protein
MCAKQPISPEAGTGMADNVASAKRVLFTGDIIRTGYNQTTPNQNKNIEWLSALFAPSLRWAFGKPSSVLRSNPEDGFDIQTFYHLCEYGLKPNSRNWALLFDTPAISRNAVDYILGHFENSFVVGLEIPKVFCKIMTLASIPYIDITIHPVRYGRELLLGLATNVDAISRRMKEFSVQEDEHYVEASLYKASSPDISSRLRPGILIGGQTLGDRVSIHNGRFISLLDYRSQLTEIIKNQEVAYFKRHPLVRNDHDIIRFMSSFPNVRFIDENIYDLLCGPTITGVYSLCSGISIEAQYFGVQGHMLHTPINLFHEIDGVAKDKKFDEVFVTIKDWTLNGEWWRYIAGLSDKLPSGKRAYSSQSPIRDTLKQDWGRRKN